jgi:hypothetical protein
MASVKLIAKRLLLMLAGYLVAVLAGLLAIVAIYAVLSSLPNAPAYFSLAGLTPVAMLVVPPLGIFIYLVTVVVTAPQTLVFALIAEFFLLRNALVHVLFGAAAAAGGSFLFWPQSPQDMDAGRWADIGIIAAAGLVAGMVYWLLAGRDAGFRRPFK